MLHAGVKLSQRVLIREDSLELDAMQQADQQWLNAGQILPCETVCVLDVLLVFSQS